MTPLAVAVLAWPVDCAILLTLRAILRRAARLARHAWDVLTDAALSDGHVLNKAAAALLWPHLTAYALWLWATESFRTRSSR